MNKGTNIVVFILSIVLFSLNISAQDTAPTAPIKNLDNGTVAEQFDYVIDNSNRYQTFKVIKKAWIFALKDHVLDSLESFESEIADLNSQIKTKSDKISELEYSLTGVESNLTSVTGERDNIKFMGSSMTKAKYKSMMWAVIAGLAALFIFFFLRYRSSNGITKSVRNDFTQLQAEFATHKKSALAREQELARKLQDEINRVN
ncbi:MAG: septal ring factor EnvC (AmiA/AmiB activator) [Patiriisocius sp.]|jgi:septal ring factor EnvC (AmiA/AmiB activator)